MSTISQATGIVFHEKKNIVLGVLAALFFGTIFVLSSGSITFFPEGPFFDFTPLRIVTLVMLAFLSGAVVPMQWYALRKAKSGLKAGTPSFGGLITGIAALSCCTPLLLPAVLSFVGFSGTQLLVFNATIKQYVVPLSLLSIGLLFLSLVMVSRSVVAACRIPPKST